jgi:hypothetical protein
MIDEQYLLRRHVDLAHKETLDPQLLIEVVDHRLAKDTPCPGEHSQPVEQDTLELHEGLLVEHHIVQVVPGNTGRLQAELDGMMRKATVMFLAGETLFFGRRHQHAIVQQRHRRVVIEARHAQDKHQNCLPASSSDGLAGNSMGCQ